MIKHYNIFLSGKVQGVGFRYYTKMKAQELKITGFVKNKADRSVYIEAEGEEENLIEFLKWCEQGPVQAYVSSMNHSESPPNHFIDFDIR